MNQPPHQPPQQPLPLPLLPGRRQSSTAPREPMNCASCRKRKIKCSRTRPSCTACESFGEACIYDAVPKKRGPKGGGGELAEELNRRIKELEQQLDSSRQEDGVEAALNGLKAGDGRHAYVVLGVACRKALLDRLEERDPELYEGLFVMESLLPLGTAFLPITPCLPPPQPSGRSELVKAAMLVTRAAYYSPEADSSLPWEQESQMSALRRELSPPTEGASTLASTLTHLSHILLLRRFLPLHLRELASEPWRSEIVETVFQHSFSIVGLLSSSAQPQVSDQLWTAYAAAEAATILTHGCFYQDTPAFRGGFEEIMAALRRLERAGWCCARGWREGCAQVWAAHERVVQQGSEARWSDNFWGRYGGLVKEGVVSVLGLLEGEAGGRREDRSRSASRRPEPVEEEEEEEEEEAVAGPSSDFVRARGAAGDPMLLDVLEGMAEGGCDGGGGGGPAQSW